MTRKPTAAAISIMTDDEFAAFIKESGLKTVITSKAEGHTVPAGYFDDCGECAKGECDGCEMCVSMREFAT